MKKKKIKIQEQSIDKRLIIKAPTLINKSNLMSDIIALSERGSSQDVNIFLVGESGTGKELIARHIHSTSKFKKAKLSPLLIVAVEI